MSWAACGCLTFNLNVAQKLSEMGPSTNLSVFVFTHLVKPYKHVGYQGKPAKLMEQVVHVDGISSRKFDAPLIEAPETEVVRHSFFEHPSALLFRSGRPTVITVNVFDTTFAYLHQV